MSLSIHIRPARKLAFAQAMLFFLYVLFCSFPSVVHAQAVPSSSVANSSATAVSASSAGASASAVSASSAGTSASAVSASSAGASASAASASAVKGATSGAASAVKGATSVASDLATIQKQIHALQSQMSTLNNNINAVNAAAKPLAQTANTVSNQVNAFPDKVTAFRQKYGIPLNNPSLDDEWAGIQRYLLRKAGMSPKQADIMAAKMAKTPVMEHLKQPFRPSSIATAVGITAGLNILGQIRSGEKPNLAEAMSFVKEKTFWGGMMASGFGYAISSYIAAAVLPPGVGVIAAIVPTFAGMLGSALGWEVGASNGESFSEIFKKIDFAQMVGQAAGSSLGVILGGQLAMVMFAGLGTIAGPLGAIAGALILGPIGARIAGFLRDFIMGDPEGLKKAGAEVSSLLAKTDQAIGTLEEHGYIPPAEALGDLPASAQTTELKAKYSDLYGKFLDAHDKNKGIESLLLLRELRETKAALDSMVSYQIQNR